MRRNNVATKKIKRFCYRFLFTIKGIRPNYYQLSSLDQKHIIDVFESEYFKDSFSIDIRLSGKTVKTVSLIEQNVNTIDNAILSGIDQYKNLMKGNVNG